MFFICNFKYLYFIFRHEKNKKTLEHTKTNAMDTFSKMIYHQNQMDSRDKYEYFNILMLKININGFFSFTFFLNYLGLVTLVPHIHLSPALSSFTSICITCLYIPPSLFQSSSLINIHVIY